MRTFIYLMVGFAFTIKVLIYVIETMIIGRFI